MFVITDNQNVILNEVIFFFMKTFIVFGTFSHHLEIVDVDEAVVGFFAEYADHIVQAVGDDSEVC